MQTPLELRHLRTLLALRHTGSLSRAAELLNLTQSALSHQIKLLESIYDAPIFERKSVPPRFTALGTRLLDLAEQVVPLVDIAERDIKQLADGRFGQLRVAVECHTCFDWLIPAMDAFRERWPGVELDIVSGFHADPIGLIHTGRADIAIVSEMDADESGILFMPLFRYDIVAILSKNHRLVAKEWLEASDFAEETLITYPVADTMLDIMRQVLTPSGIQPHRRTSELTVALLQLVASGRGIAALPLWSVQKYIERAYVISRPVTAQGLKGDLFATCAESYARRPFAADFVQQIREHSFLTLPGITLMQAQQPEQIL